MAVATIPSPPVVFLPKELYFYLRCRDSWLLGVGRADGTHSTDASASSGASKGAFSFFGFGTTPATMSMM